MRLGSRKAGNVRSANGDDKGGEIGSQMSGIGENGEGSGEDAANDFDEEEGGAEDGGRFELFDYVLASFFVGDGSAGFGFGFGWFDFKFGVVGVVVGVAVGGMVAIVGVAVAMAVFVGVA